MEDQFITEAAKAGVISSMVGVVAKEKTFYATVIDQAFADAKATSIDDAVNKQIAEFIKQNADEAVEGTMARVTGFSIADLEAK